MPIWILFFLLVALAPVAAPLLAGSHPLAALLLRDFFSRLCHQNPARSFLLEGSPVAVCTRCLGIYVGAAAGVGLRAVSRYPMQARFLGLSGQQSRHQPPPAHSSLRLEWGTLGFAVALLLNGLDVATEALRWHGNQPMFRFVLGLLLGSAVGFRAYVRTKGGTLIGQAGR
jgi:hypothetical protein